MWSIKIAKSGGVKLSAMALNEIMRSFKMSKATIKQCTRYYTDQNDKPKQ
jgi:hypothetical protein